MSVSFGLRGVCLLEDEATRRRHKHVQDTSRVAEEGPQASLSGGASLGQCLQGSCILFRCASP